MITLKDRFTQNQIDKLSKIGITTPFQFVTCFPNSVQKILPFSSFKPQFLPNPQDRFLHTAVLHQIERRSGRRPFFILHFLDPQTRQMVRAYLFTIASYTAKQLIIGSTYQVLLAFRNNFLNVEKYALYQQNDQSGYNQNHNQNYFLLGKINPNSSAILPVYSQVGFLNSNYFLSLHKRLKPEDYLLDLRGLVEKGQDFFPEILDTAGIHRPKNLQDFEKNLRYWISFKVYLRLQLMNYLNAQSKLHLAKTGTFLLSDLVKMVNSLPFTLSPSQKTTTWDLIQQVCHISKD